MLYLDAVLTDRMHPLFNGTPEETVKWLEEHNAVDTPGLQVCRGIDMVTVSVEAYLTAANERKEAGNEQKLKNVARLVLEAMERQNEINKIGVVDDGYQIQAAEQIARKIVDLFN